MGVETTLSAINTLLKTLQNPQLKKILSIIGQESQLDGLKSLIHDIIRKFEAHHRYIEQNRIEAFKDAVYEANVQLETLVSLAAQKQLLEADAGVTLSKKMCFYYYRFNRHGIPCRVSQVINNIRKVLVAEATGDVGIVHKDPTPVPDSSRWISRTESNIPGVNEGQVIGREKDLENIVCMLLDSNIQQDVSFLSIAGVAGLGKTALAQLVLNDSRVEEAFSLRMWVRVAGKELEIKSILHDILYSTTGYTNTKSTMDKVQNLVRQHLSGEKYLLVLDDVWTEKPDQLRQLADCLIGVQRGSWIIMTTRLRRTATAIQDGQVYELQGLSEENSSQLFQMELFRQDKSNDKNLMVIAEGILAACAGNPLAIRKVGRLLYNQNKKDWGRLRDIELASITENHIVSVVRPSYDSLESPLKSCFIYCALFPKDFTINKHMLISLWMAQDYIYPLNTGVSPEDLGEEYFSTLLDKYFFKDIKRDKYGEIVSCKMQGIIHVLAQQLAQKEMYIMSDFQNKLDERVHHVSFLRRYQIDIYFLGNTNILSYLHVGDNFNFCKVIKSSLEVLLLQFRSLKALDLCGLLFESLPDSIGELLLLRYLNFSGNTIIEVLPRTLTRLHNLQTLNLQNCHRLKELPKDFSMLIKLRLLNIKSCFSLTCMPRGIGKLTCLHKLSDFKVSDKGSSSSWKEVFDVLEDLKPLDNLRGNLSIEIRCPSGKYIAKEDAKREGIYILRNKERLKAIEFDFKHEEFDGLDIEKVTRLMKVLQPPANLQYIKLWRYQGARMGWDTFPSNLVQLLVVGCWELECLPFLGNLCHLKVLQLLKLKKLEYIEQDGPLADSSSTSTSPLVSEMLSSCYPSLETLWLENLPKLKGWRKVATDNDLHEVLNDGGDSSNNNDKAQWQLKPCFSHLKSLFIWNCPQLTWIPTCPTVEDLKLVNFNSRLRIIESIGDEKLDVASTSASHNFMDILKYSNWRSYIQKGKNIEKVALSNMACLKNIKKVALSNVAWLSFYPMEAFMHLENLEIWCDKEVESLVEVEQVFRSFSSSLRVLIIHNCSSLKNVEPGGLKHLTAMEKLELRNCDNLTLLEDQKEEKRGDSTAIGLINWSRNLQSLHILKLEGLPHLLNLPGWMQFLPSLRCLCISFCNKIKSLPDWIPKITSLRQIIVNSCSASFEKRCREHEEDWRHIQFQFRNCYF